MGDHISIVIFTPRLFAFPHSFQSLLFLAHFSLPILKHALGMDMLHSASSALEYPQTQAPDEINALCVSSGNIQSSTVSLGDGVENQRPLSLGEGTDEASIKAPFRLFQPPVALGSNDFADRSFEQKQQRKSSKSRYPSRALLNQDRPYLSHPKYEEYRRRPRQDIGKDGKAIWPQPIEDAFQDGTYLTMPDAVGLT